jgi:hypothetical protein
MGNFDSDIQLKMDLRFVTTWIIMGCFLSIAFLLSITILVRPDIHTEQFCFVLAILIPGTCQGIIQMPMLVRYTNRYHYTWFVITFGSYIVGCGLIYILLQRIPLKQTFKAFFDITNNVPFAILKGILLGTFLGSIIGIVIGATQWLFARREIELLRWLSLTIKAWIIGLGIPLALFFWFVADLRGE